MAFNNNDGARDRFWKWFIAHESQLDRFIRSKDRDRDHRVYDRLTTEIRRVHMDLTPELTIDDAKISVLVLSCDGKKNCVAEVISLADRAPEIQGWRIQRFRSPMPDAAIKYEGLTLDVKQINAAYKVDREKNKVHVLLLIDGYKEGDMRYEGAAFLVMDHTIGEYNTIMHVGSITFRAPDHESERFHLITLNGLRELIEREFY